MVVYKLEPKKCNVRILSLSNSMYIVNYTFMCIKNEMKTVKVIINPQS